MTFSKKKRGPVRDTVLGLASAVAESLEGALRNEVDHGVIERVIDSAILRSADHAAIFTESEMPYNNRQSVVTGLTAIVGRIKALETPDWPGIAQGGAE